MTEWKKCKRYSGADKRPSNRVQSEREITHRRNRRLCKEAIRKDKSETILDAPLDGWDIA